MTDYVYMVASQKRDSIYIGVTNDLGRRIVEHKDGKGSRFTSRYGVARLGTRNISTCATQSGGRSR